MRENLRHYIDITMNKQLNNAANEMYWLLGDGITSLTEEFNATENTVHYINEKSPRNRVLSYQRTFEVDKEFCQDAVQAWMEKLVDNLYVENEARTSFIRFRLTDATETSGIYNATKVPCIITMVSEGGDAGAEQHIVMKVAQDGEAVRGTFDLSKLVTGGAFTPA